MSLAGVLTEIRRLRERVTPPPLNPLRGKYHHDPESYAREVIGATWTEAQCLAAHLLHTPPYKVICKAGHNVGKTHLLGTLINHHYDTYDPGAVISTSPTQKHVRTVLWGEVRRQRGQRGGFSGPRVPELRTSDSHWAEGYAVNKGESFQGRHPAGEVLFVFDEVVGIDAIYIEVAKSMFKGDGRHRWICTLNPTDTTSAIYQEEMRGGWHTVTINPFEHPNIAAELAGLPPPFPAAVSTVQLQEWLRDWFDPIPPEDATKLDIEFPPGSGRWYRPGPLGESRALGRWPSQATAGVWSEAAWLLAEGNILPDGLDLPQIGCDVARHGDDYTAIHAQQAGTSLHHERHNGWELSTTAGRLKQLCKEMAEHVTKQRPPQAAPIDARDIPVKVDPDGMGWGVLDMREDYNWIGISAAAQSASADYFNRRSELWFYTMLRAKAGLVSFARLPRGDRQRLRLQCMAPIWKPDGKGAIKLEPKEETKKRLGYSPDDMDAVNLAYWPGLGISPPEALDEEDEFEDPDFPKKGPADGLRPRRGHAAKRGLFGSR